MESDKAKTQVGHCNMVMWCSRDADKGQKGIRECDKAAVESDKTKLKVRIHSDMLI